MRRRTIIAGAGAGIAGLGGLALSGGVAAEEDVQTGALNIESQKVKTEDGQLSSVRLANIVAIAEYENFDSDIAEVAFTISATSAEDETVEKSKVVEDPGQTETVTGLPALDLASLVDDVDEDGGSETYGITYELVAEVKDEDRVDNGGGAVTDTVGGSSPTDLEIVNMPANTDAGGEGVVRTYESLGSSENGELELSASYAPDRYAYRVDLDDPWADDSETHANVGIGFDFEPATNTYQYQLNWSAAEDFFHHENAIDKKPGLPEGVTAEREEKEDGGAVFTFLVDPSVAFGGFPGDGETYKYVANASYGGEGEHVNVSTDGENAWGAETEDGYDFTRNDYFKTTTVNHDGE